ncbi:M48 family metallopeptidase [Celeribacter sp.]|uniref:M48 family metallopeptidase n=1 Tax=Celeribacter sp. TaxID=1890673 RepID=UPI003A8D36B0
MGDIILDGNPPVGVTLRRSSRAKRLSLRVSRLDGRVTLSMPARLPEREALAFLREKEDWIRKHLGTRAPEQAAVFGASVPFLGREVEIVPGKGRRALLKDGRLEVPGEADRVAARVKAFLKLEAQMRLREASDRYAALLNTDYGRITLRDPRSRWGSCTSAGNLMYSWRLVMAPAVVLDYVAAHEVAHRLEMNHSDRFWAHVARVCPDHAAHRRWLHTEGEKLHAWRFETD